MSKYHAVSSGMVTRQALPSITRQRGTTTGSANLMLYGAGKTTVSNNTTFVDSSANNFTVTRVNDTVQSGFNPFSQASAGAGYFDGTGDYLTCADNAAFAFGTGDFTVEYWIYPTAFPGFAIVDTRTSGGSTTGYSDYITSAGKFGLYINNSTIFLSTASIPANAWTHVAITRSGTSLRVFFNGVQQNSTVTNSTSMSDTKLLVGAGVGVTPGTVQAVFLTGYLTNVRLVKGTAVYTSNFTPPTSPLTAITNTSLLLLMDNYSIVNSTSTNLPVTINGNTTISTAQFPTGMSSSMYFDGTGDYLSIPYNAAFDFSTGNWTVELWWYPTTTGVDQNLIMVNFSGSDGYAHARITATTTNKFYILSSTNGLSWINTTQIGSWTTGQWYHLAYVRNGSTFTLYVNGVSAGSYSSSSTLTNFSGSSEVGRNNVTSGVQYQYAYGYISNVRVCKGTALYTANFTPPALPMSTTVTVPAFVTNNIYGVNQIP